MKKLGFIAVAALLMGVSSVASAQAPQGQAPGQGRGNRGMQMMMQGITLSAEQQVKLDSISAKYMEQRQAIMNDESLDMDGRRAKMREMMPKQQDEIKALLTDEQKKLFDKNVEDMRARMQQGGGQRPPR